MRKRRKRSWNPLQVVAAIAGVVLLVWIAFPLFLAPFFDAQGAGFYGDQYGALNTLFSGLAFVGLIATIWFQHQELRATRQEMRAQREEFARGSAAQEKSVRVQALVGLIDAGTQLMLHEKQLMKQREEEVRTKRDDYHGRTGEPIGSTMAASKLPEDQRRILAEMYQSVSYHRDRGLALADKIERQMAEVEALLGGGAAPETSRGSRSTTRPPAQRATAGASKT